MDSRKMKWVRAQAQARLRRDEEEEEEEGEEELWLVLVVLVVLVLLRMALMALSNGHRLCHWTIVFRGSIGFPHHWSWAPVAPLARLDLCFAVDRCRYRSPPSSACLSTWLCSVADW